MVRLVELADCGGEAEVDGCGGAVVVVEESSRKENVSLCIDALLLLVVVVVVVVCILSFPQSLKAGFGFCLEVR